MLVCSYISYEIPECKYGSTRIHTRTQEYLLGGLFLGNGSKFPIHTSISQKNNLMLPRSMFSILTFGVCLYIRVYACTNQQASSTNDLPEEQEVYRALFSLSNYS